MSSFERNYWEDDSKVKKWASGKGKVRLAWVKWAGRYWIDLRILRREEDGYTHTKEGIRLTPEQIVNSALDIEEALDEGYFKTNDEVDLLLIRNNNPIKLKLKLIDPYN